ncbi:MAG TPA: MFS transporter, partial [Candidatus Acidoferrales bacterium]|nr:MFS transporter [Candidatus Acidoferrales bacterium]
AVLVALLLMRFPKMDAAGRGTLFSDIRRGLSYISRERLLADLLINYGSLMFFAAAYTVLLALVGVAVLGTTPEQLGVLYTAIGIGTIVGSLGVASLGNFAYKGRLLTVTSLLMSLSVILFSQLHFYAVSFALLIIVAASQSIASALSITLLQLNAPRHLIGLVMSINTLIVLGIRPLGAFPFGALADFIGVSGALAVGAVLSAAISVVLFATNSRLRNA